MSCGRGLQKHGLKVHLRNPDSYTPCLKNGRSLLLGSDMEENKRQIAKFSKQDAEVNGAQSAQYCIFTMMTTQAYQRYEHWMSSLCKLE